MKKIIATVLAMVMALALCTTAMAATTYGDFYKWDGGWVKQNMDGVSISYTAASESKTDGKLVSATRGYFTLTNGDNAGTYVEVPAADAKYQLTVDGTVKYLDKVTMTEHLYTNCIGSKPDWSLGAHQVRRLRCCYYRQYPVQGCRWQGLCGWRECYRRR